jgi:hypothetical protein
LKKREKMEREGGGGGGGGGCGWGGECMIQFFYDLTPK